MTRLIYFLIEIIAKFHNKFLSINDRFGVPLNDKQLHFLIIGAIGLGLIMVIQPIFNWLSKNDGVLFISFIYVFTVVLVITFAIEIGQGFAGTGDMDFYDIVSGVFGFFVFFAIYLMIYLIYKSIKNSHTK